MGGASNYRTVGKYLLVLRIGRAQGRRQTEDAVSISTEFTKQTVLKEAALNRF